MNVFISQPMRGISDEEILKLRDQATEELKGRFYSVNIIPSFFTSTSYDNPVRMLGESIRLMSQADFVYFMKGWERARGCIIEHNVAIAYDIPCLYQ